MEKLWNFFSWDLYEPCVFFFTTVKVVFITGGEALPQHHYHLTLFDIENPPSM